MLSPKRVRFRKQQKGRMMGAATRGNTITFGEYGLQATTCGYITNRQIEAARIAISRKMKRGGNLWIKILIFIHSYIFYHIYCHIISLLSTY